MNISEASRKTGVSADMIRFYERKGLISPKRHPHNNYRDYSDQDLFQIVLIRHYNCFGLSLDDIRRFFENGNIEEIMGKLQQALDTLEEEEKWISQRITSAKDVLAGFEILSEDLEYKVSPFDQFYFYERTSYDKYAELYAYQSAKPAFRIRRENIGCEVYPHDQGMMFNYPISTDLSYSLYENGLIYKTCVKMKPDSLISSETILPIIAQMEKNGYRLKGDIFAVQIFSSETQDVISLNILSEQI